MIAIQKKIPRDFDRARIAVAVGCSTSTVLRAYQGCAGPYTTELVRQAARRLGLPLPPATDEPGGAS